MYKLYQWLNDNNFPSCYLPEGYLTLIKDDNGGSLVYGEREYQFFLTDEVIEYYNSYMFSEFMPYAFPFAMDGYGNFYVFNLRTIDECVYTVAASNMGWERDECFKIADNFMECLSQKYLLDRLIK